MISVAEYDEIELAQHTRVLLLLGRILWMQDRNGEAEVKLEEAKSEFVTIGDRQGAAQCQQSLGDILQMQNRYGEAEEKLEEAKSEFAPLEIDWVQLSANKALG